MHFQKFYSNRLIIRTLKSDDISDDYISALNDKTINIYTEARYKRWTYEDCLNFISLRFFIKINCGI